MDQQDRKNMRELLKTLNITINFHLILKGIRCLTVCINSKHSGTSGTNKSFGLWIWQPQHHPYWLLKAWFSLTNMTGASQQPQSLIGQAVSFGVKLQNSQQCGQCPALPHTTHFSVWTSCTSHITQSWSGCTSHLWKTPCCWIPNMAREHSYFKTESPFLWHKLNQYFKPCAPGWSSVSHTQCCSLSRNYSFFLQSTLSWALYPQRTWPRWDVCVCAHTSSLEV